MVVTHGKHYEHMSSNLTRQYYGHQITSTPTGDDVGDGWVHDLSKDGVDLGTFPTLAEAIHAAKAANAEPVVVDSPVVMELTEQEPARKRKSK